jgi:ribosomal protein S18 acetylase RimI-like enzyme
MRDGVVELGIVVFDFTSGDAGEVELVEIYVLPTLRSRGVGAEALRLAESFAQKAGRTFMTLYAEPLDDDTDDAKEALIKWYTRLGYRELGPCDRLGKSLTDTS